MNLAYTDHERITVDLSNTPSRGTIYVAGEGDVPTKHWPLPRNSAVLLSKSTDGGRTFLPAKVIADNNLPLSDPLRGGGDAVEGLCVLSDGTLVVGVTRYPANGAGKKRCYRVVALASHDRGLSFSAEHTVATPMVNGGESRNMATFWQKPEFSVFRNRLYSVFNDVSAGTAKVFLNFSADGGKTWSAPVNVDTAWRKGDGDSQMNAAVNGNGTVGVIYYHTDLAHGNQFDVFFAASTDGGRSFLPPARVSTATSYPYSGGNLRLLPTDRVTNARYVNATLENGLSWGNGGHYIGIAAATDGNFHLLWTDARNGIYQLYAAKVAVVPGNAETSSSISAIQSLNTHVRLVLDPISYDPATRTMAMPVRIQNISKETIAGPVTLTYIAPRRFQADLSPLGGKTLSYAHAFGTLGRLEPGEVSGAVTWKLRVGDPQSLVIAEPTFTVWGKLVNGK